MHQDLDEYQVLTTMKIPDNYRSAGFIYVLQNDSMPGIYKVGMTKNEPEARAREISCTTGVPTPFKVLAAFHSNNPRADERMVHEAYNSCRVSNNREFFSLPTKRDIDDALSEFQAVVGPERNADVAELAMIDMFISFSNERDLNLEEELYEHGIGGVNGNLAAVRNFLIRSGIQHVKNLIEKHHSSIVINPDSSVSLVKSLEIQWEEAQHAEQCSEG